MFYLDDVSDEPPGFKYKSSATDWEPWIQEVLPANTQDTVKKRMKSNLKHIIVGLEMKADLIISHQNASKSILFESYAQIMTFEFCVGVFSVCEGLGSVYYLASKGNNRRQNERVYFNEWKNELITKFDSDSSLEGNLETVKSVRDKLHQDKLGVREDIDWHSFGYQEAFQPAISALSVLFKQHADKVPETTNLLGPPTE